MIQRIAGAGLGRQPGPGRQRKTLRGGSRPQLSGSTDRVTLNFSGSRDLFQVLSEVSAQRIRENFSEKANPPGPEARPEVNSAESAASRIVNMAVEVLGSNAQHSTLKELNGKVAKLNSSIDEGFNQAQELLSAMGARPGDIQASMAEAYRLVTEGVRSFYWEEVKGLGEKAPGS